ncbi:MAG: O-antigen ligase family protein, partial [Bacteroidales bacterium]|nr:O-antigen ligase family protein [Bacteroidales bacterium]
MNKISMHHKCIYLADIVLFGLMCGISLFAVSELFVNREITAKWFGLILTVSFAGILWHILHRNVYAPVQPVFMLIAACLILVPLRDGYVSGFNLRLLIFPGGLLLMLYFLIQMTETYPASDSFRLITAVVVGMAGYGLLQYAGIFRTLNPNFRITGGFDNPAGFAAALSITLPYAVYLIRETAGRTRYISMAAFAVILSAIVLSGSRAAVTACLVVAVCYLCCRFSGIKLRKWMPLAIAVLLIASAIMLYFLKKDSADGRLLIWQRTWDMIRDHPMMGHGQGAFQAKYMLYQAGYFEAYPDSRYASLADNVLHPFNEYLLVWSEHGIAGLCIFALLGFMLIRSYHRSPDFTKFIAGLSLLAVVVFSFFS